MKKYKQSINNSAGFTIIELLIATAVFATVMLTLMYGILEISRIYYRGITQSNTQNVARDIINNVSQALQFNGKYIGINVGSANPVSPGNPLASSNQGFCAGSTLYSYLLGYQLSNSYVSTGKVRQSPHALVASDNCSSTTIPQVLSNSGVSGSELLAQHMRLAYLKITPLTSSFSDTYSIEVRVVYGDDDLLCNTSVSISGTNSCLSSATMPTVSDFVGQDVTCKQQAGDQFCAVADLSTIVQSRLD